MTPERPLTILHEDQEFVVVEKVPGLLSVPGRGPDKQDCVTARVRARYPACIPQPSVHRLDMETSGLMVVALSAPAHRTLSRQFEVRTVQKTYEAILDGQIPAGSGTIELRFRLDVDNRPLQIYDADRGKLGVTHWKTLEQAADTRIEFVPVTGRTHQLRVHSAHELGLGVPIVGDSLYGRGVGVTDLKLHATRLVFHHPSTGVEMSFHSPAPF